MDCLSDILKNITMPTTIIQCSIITTSSLLSDCYMMALLYSYTLRNILIPSHTDVGISPSQATYSNIDNIMYIIVILPEGSYAVRLVTVAQEINENATSDLIGGKMEFSLSFKPHALILHMNACVALTRCIYRQKLVNFNSPQQKAHFS